MHNLQNLIAVATLIVTTTCCSQEKASLFSKDLTDSLEVRNVLTVLGGKKEGEKDKNEVIGSVTGTGQTLAAQSEQLQKSVDGLAATNETLLKANEGLRNQISVYERSLDAK